MRRQIVHKSLLEEEDTLSNLFILMLTTRLRASHAPHLMSCCQTRYDSHHKFSYFVPQRQWYPPLPSACQGRFSPVGSQAQQGLRRLEHICQPDFIPSDLSPVWIEDSLRGHGGSDYRPNRLAIQGGCSERLCCNGSPPFRKAPTDAEAIGDAFDHNCRAAEQH